MNPNLAEIFFTYFCHAPKNVMQASDRFFFAKIVNSYLFLYLLRMSENQRHSNTGAFPWNMRNFWEQLLLQNTASATAPVYEHPGMASSVLLCLEHFFKTVLLNFIGLKSNSHLPRKQFYLLRWEPLKNDEKCF